MPAIHLHARCAHRRHAVRDIDLFGGLPARAIAPVLREPRLALQPEHAVAIEGQRERAFVAEFRQAAEGAARNVQQRHTLAAGHPDLAARRDHQCLDVAAAKAMRGIRGDVPQHATAGGVALLHAATRRRQPQRTVGGHLQLVAQAGVVPVAGTEHTGMDDEDGLMGLPTDPLTSARTENAEIYLPDLGKWLEVRSRYLNWVDGRLAQMVIATDITPRRQAEELASQQAERAQTASRLITMGEMASSVAHELNQPLTAISNYCSGMISRIKAKQISEEDMLSALDKTAKQAQRAGQIIQRIRSFVKRSAPNRSLSNVPAMVEAAKELADIEMRRSNVHLSLYVAARLPELLVDPILIEQVLINLLKNAAESVDAAQRSPANRSVELRVTPKRIEDRQVVEFEVLDTGLGLPPEVMARLYESFFSTKAEGMGMGLSLCRSIVESHAGRIAAENIYNGANVVGCRFVFWIPLQTESLSEILS